jgi:hypothetical protein
MPQDSRKLAALLWLVAGLAPPLAAQDPPPRPRPRIADVSWLRGCWIAATPRRIVEEHWTDPRGRSMIGVNRTVRGDSLVDYELVILRETDSTLAYEAHPARQPVATFHARTATATGVVFENPMHDFPQRVGYRLVGDSLFAYIEGMMPGAAAQRRIEFPFARARCPQGGT